MGMSREEFRRRILEQQRQRKMQETEKCEDDNVLGGNYYGNYYNERYPRF